MSGSPWRCCVDFPDAPVKKDYVLFEAGADPVDAVTLLRGAIPDECN